MAEKNTESSPARSGSTTPQQQTSQQGERQQRGAATLQRRSSLPRLAGAFDLSPFALARRMMEDMDRMFDFAGAGNRHAGALWSPPVEAIERDGRFVLRAELPGLSPDDVRLEVQDDALVLEGERKRELEAEENGVIRSERTYGRFSRVIPLPDGAQADQAEAKFENGVLEVSVPVREASSRGRRIEIRGSSAAGSSVH